MQKASGSYYTPDALADFVVAKSVTTLSSSGIIHILEPSSGDDAFVTTFHRRPDRDRFSIDAVEISKKVIDLAKSASDEKASITYYNEDFLFFKPKRRYDLVVGNPPYIKKKLLKVAQIKQCKNIHFEAGLKDRAINNIWTSFLVKSVAHLTDRGVLAFVLPAELLQVKYALEIQSFLRKHFNRIEIFTFKEIVFPDIGQDTVALIARKDSDLPEGVFFGEIKNLSNLSKENIILTQSKAAERNEIKWSGHIISEAEIEFLLNTCSQLKPVSHYCDSGAGIVTGANNFFIVTKQVCDKYELKNVTLPIIQRGQFVNEGIVFNAAAFEEIVEKGKPCYLLDFTGRKLTTLSEGARKYIKLGKDKKYAERFKCKIRKRWYDVPSIWSSEAFYFKRCHLYPKLLKNSAKVLVTDSAYRIRVKNGFAVNSFVFSFYNSLTLALAELKGRFYGGGVLELTPNEFKSVPMPYVEIDLKEFQSFQRAFKQEKPIDTILKGNDKKLLRDYLNLSSEDVGRLQAIRKKLLDRRLRHK
jgi:adenine-specific DNA-methyltransferase